MGSKNKPKLSLNRLADTCLTTPLSVTGVQESQGDSSPATHPKSTSSRLTAPKFCRSVNAGIWKAAITQIVRVTGIRYMTCGSRGDSICKKMNKAVTKKAIFPMWCERSALYDITKGTKTAANSPPNSPPSVFTKPSQHQGLILHLLVSATIN